VNFCTKFSEHTYKDSRVKLLWSATNGKWHKWSNWEYVMQLLVRSVSLLPISAPGGGPQSLLTLSLWLWTLLYFIGVQGQFFTLYVFSFCSHCFALFSMNFVFLYSLHKTREQIVCIHLFFGIWILITSKYSKICQHW
jgi:hypothetical protein